MLTGPDGDDVAALFGRAWRLPVANTAKEVWWALVYDAFMAPLRLGQHGRCVCGAPAPGRRHYFWDCPVASAVVSELQRFLPPGAGQLSCKNVWFLDPPSSQAANPWTVVSLSFLSCLEHVRRVAVRRSFTPAPQGPLTVEMASRRAIAYFWAGIGKFCSLNVAPVTWRAQPCSFFAWGTDGESVRRWIARLERTPPPSPASDSSG